MSSSGLNLENYLIPLEEINRATENFCQERYIGGGGFGKVYRGQLSDHWKNCTVAIKRLDRESYQGVDEFRNELKIISTFHHENIISFIGYCDQGNEMIIVYEYASKGSLDHHLGDRNKMCCITWTKRLEICIGAARGLNHLHSGIEEQRSVIHRDVKSANILLDDNLIPKICDFGLSKLGAENQPNTSVQTKVAGTQYYMDPNYQESRILRKDSDVYSFGVVLFEILSGMLAYRERSIGDKLQILMQSVRLYHEEKPDIVIDPDIRDQINIRSFDTFKQIAYQCISQISKERPTLDTVIKKLEDALTIQTSEGSGSTRAERSEIESLLYKLSSVNPHHQQTACAEICLLTKLNVDNCIAFGKANAIHLLTPLLKSTDSETQGHALTAFLNLSTNDDNKRIIMDKAIVGLIHVLSEGNMTARENATSIIFSLAEIDKYKGKLGSAGSIEPLLSLFWKGNQRRKKDEMVAFFNLCAYRGNKGLAMNVGLIHFLMELLREPRGEMWEEALTILSILTTHPHWKSYINEAEAVPLLVEIIERGSRKSKENAIPILMKLFSTYEPDTEEVLDLVTVKLGDMLRHNTNRGLKNAQDLLTKITYVAQQSKSSSWVESSSWVDDLEAWKTHYECGLLLYD